jgi:phytanoyl-CoA hydroxylase
MLQFPTPRGLLANVPVDQSEDPSHYFEVTEIERAREYYAREGYVIMKNVLDALTCDGVRELWSSEVKTSRAHIYRQATAKSEQHVFNSKGWVMNPVLNLQSLDPRLFPKFREFARERILTSSRLIAAIGGLLGEKPKIVQSMYFEGNSATWEHQDSYYLDSSKLGQMLGSWIALEDIVARAGRFFVVPRSHLVRLPLQDSSNNVATHHERYIQSVVTEIRQRNLPVRAPALRRGDVLFWNSFTVHGSLDTQDDQHTRASITCHAIPESHSFLQLQSRIIPLRTDIVNDVLVHCPKNLARTDARAVHWFESNFPTVFYGMKRAAIRATVALSTVKRKATARP